LRGTFYDSSDDPDFVARDIEHLTSGEVLRPKLIVGQIANLGRIDVQGSLQFGSIVAGGDPFERHQETLVVPASSRDHEGSPVFTDQFGSGCEPVGIVRDDDDVNLAVQSMRFPDLSHDEEIRTVVNQPPRR
jgi:hypothetical protein